jgi:hypothetical protein
LYEGDKIVVKDDKLCHYHKMGMIVLDGSEDEEWWYVNDKPFVIVSNMKIGAADKCPIYCDKIIPRTRTELFVNGKYGISEAYLNATDLTKNGLFVFIKNFPYPNIIEWVKSNPITVVYELAEPYYEDITPIQSQWVIESLEECNLDIITSLPIKANMSYITNVPSLTTLSTRVSEVKESDNLIYNLTNMLDDEINQ